MRESNDVQAPRPSKAGERIEIVAAVLLAVATVATAWSGYQASRWSGEQATAFSAASAARIESSRASTRAGQEQQVDIGLFTQWINAYANDQAELRDFYERRFRPEFRPAFEAWVATHPRTNPSAPLSPFAMPEYKLAEQEVADRRLRDAEAASELAKLDNQRSDNYVLCVVLFAAALFFAGISTRMDALRVRAAVVALGCVLFLGTVGWILTFPVSISV